MFSKPAQDDLNTIALILAAGKGTRMNSALPKPLILLENRPIIQYIIDCLHSCHIYNIAIVVGHQADLIMSTLGNQYEYVLQPEQKGTAHAVSIASDVIRPYKDLIILVGDSPLIQPDSIRRLIKRHRETNASCSFLTATFPKQFPYARVIRDSQGQVLRCIEERQATRDERQINEYLTSHYIFNRKVLLKLLDKIETDPYTREADLTNIIGMIVNDGHNVNAVSIHDYRQLVGLNTAQDLVWAENILNS